MRIATLHGSAGSTVYPTQTTIRNAVESADWEHASNFNLMLVGIQAKDAWPIAATTWVVVPANSANAAATLDFMRFALHSGQLADAQGYTPLPAKLVQLIEASWAKSFPGVKMLAR